MGLTDSAQGRASSVRTTLRETEATEAHARMRAWTLTRKEAATEPLTAQQEGACR